MMIYQPHTYQMHATQHILDNPQAGLFLDMGLGKTVSTLTALDDLLFNRMEVSKVLIIAPKRVALHTWKNEIQKWSHLSHLRLSIAVGTEKQRIAALRADADLYIINRENVAWLVTHYGTKFPFDMIVIDELSSFKNPNSQRFRALRSVRPKVKRVVGLTGTPTPNGLMDLWSQMYLLDQGERLGKTLGGYRERYFRVGASYGPHVHKYEPRKGVEEKIFSLIEDICISMKAEDYLELPELMDVEVPVYLTDRERQQYEEFERDAILSLPEDEITAVNAAALTNKLLQFANGAIYNDDKKYREVHNAKISALEEILDVANGQPVLCFYSFQSDVSRIKSHLGKYRPHLLKGESDIDRWNRGEIPFLLAHPASAGHGLNMQDGGNIVAWFGLPWSLEYYQQAVARLHRQGQTKNVINHHLVVKGSIEEEVVKALIRKESLQERCMEALSVKARQLRAVALPEYT